MTLFDPLYPGRDSGHHGLEVRADGAGPPPIIRPRHSRHLEDQRDLQSARQHRSSILFKDKSGEKLTKRMLINEGLGRYIIYRGDY